MTLKNKKRAFSLVELMILLLVSGLIIAALVPVVTKKHFRLPSDTMHGAYMCYYKNNGLHETKWAGKSQQSIVFDRDTENCVFDPPKKASYFQISAIGGGGGGGDAGYNGGNPLAYWSDVKRIHPFGLTQAWLDSVNIDKDEFLANAGQLYGYARGQNSGSGGDASYTTESTGRECTSYSWTDGCVDYDTFTGTVTKHEGSVSCYTNRRSCSWSTEERQGPCIRYSSSIDNGERIADNSKSKFSLARLFNRGALTGAAGAMSHGGGSNTGGQGGRQTGTGRPGGGTSISPPSTPGQPSTSTRTCVEYSKLTYNKETCTTSTSSSTCTWTCSIPTDGTSCTAEICVEWGGMACDNWYEYPIYTTHTQSGAPGGSGAVCVSGSVDGNLNLAGAGTTSVHSSVSNGASLPGCGGLCNDTATAGHGEASCEVYGGSSRVCTTPTQSSYDIKRNDASVASVTATSAPAGGGGAGRVPGDSGVAPSEFASDGSCTAGSSGTPCGSGWYGYCLVHDNGLGTESDGKYYYQETFDKNYLTYGNPGSPGEFKTVIVRSLTDVGTTIKIGRGGSAAALNLGQPGSDGSATSMGNFITANGGSGGAGFLARGDSQILPIYKKSVYDKEHDCYMYDRWTTEKDIDGNWKYPTERQRVLNNPPNCTSLSSASDYKYHQISGRTEGQYPTPIGIASSIMNFVFNTADNSEAVQRFIKYGRGGSGGGVEHRCWAGRWQVLFENKIMEKTSVYADYASASAYAKANNLYVPDGCRNDWSNVPATAGADGALLIKW